MNERPKILCVDDEQAVLDSLALALRKQFTVTTALGGSEGLKALGTKGPFAAVVSDLKMPGMDGTAFLSRASTAAPETVRLLLTGLTDVNSAMAAVNEGHIFMFLTKPAEPYRLIKALEAACAQHRLLTSERVLLQETLHGSVQALSDVLAIAEPRIFGRGTRIKQYAGQLARALNVGNPWEIEVAAMLSQLGAITLPSETIEKLSHGQDLSEEEQAQVDKTPETSEQILKHIPRLEGVRAILSQEGKVELAPRIAEGRSVLRIATDYDALEHRGLAPDAALDVMRSRRIYDPPMLEKLAEILGNSGQEVEIKELRAHLIEPGMVLADDLRMVTGMMVAARGYRVTESFLARLANFKAATLKEPVRVIVKKPSAAA